MSKKKNDISFINLFACDMWALGITLYQLIYFGFPFEESSRKEYKKQVQNTEYEKKSDNLFDRIIASLLKKTPSDRLSST